MKQLAKGALLVGNVVLTGLKLGLIYALTYILVVPLIWVVGKLGGKIFGVKK